METTVEVLFTPADFMALAGRDLSRTVCVVFDVLRATTSIVTALGHGAVAIRPVRDIPEALAARDQEPGLLLAGERGGLAIPAQLTGSVAFDLGNSPREFTAARVKGRRIAMTTTNGTLALRACAPAAMVLAACFLNLGPTAELLQRRSPDALLIVCSGTFEQAAYEDMLGAGALCEEIWTRFGPGAADSAHAARKLFLLDRHDLAGAVAQARNGRRLLSRPDLRDDVAFCVQLGLFDFAAELGRDGWITRSGPG